ncbi:MAG TPA: electron transfer flavoprotein subunit alpha/FixB family protein [Corynebacteriales bacterium]|nr:electron transfer flavoprotein subunit alpha/FixB family protein [Mycobacteriales bacterium]
MTTLLIPVSYHGQGKNAELAHITLEAILAAHPHGDVAAVVIGQPGTAAALQADLSQAGVSAIYAAEADDALLSLGVTETDVISKIAVDKACNGIVLPDSVLNREIAGRLAARLGSGIASDVVALTAPNTVTHSIFGSQLDVHATVHGPTPVVILRNGVVEVPADSEAQSEKPLVEIEEVEIPRGGTARSVRVTSMTPEETSDRPDLTTAKIVVAGGRGVCSPENFATLVEGLADELGAAVGSTRDAVDLDYCAGATQIGQTGVTIAPELYIGLGISGAIQHKAGMQNAKRIVVVNNDPEAPLFSIADLGIVGDATEVVPALLELLHDQD